MSKSVNKWIGLGNCGRDPEMRSTGGGTLAANLSLACSDRRKDSQGNWQDQTEWINLQAFGRTAEIIRDYVQKGAKLYVEGRIQTQSWEKDGQKRYRTVVIVNELVLLDGKRDTQQRTAPQTQNQDVSDDGVPF